MRSPEAWLTIVVAGVLVTVRHLQVPEAEEVTRHQQKHNQADKRRPTIHTGDENEGLNPLVMVVV